MDTCCDAYLVTGIWQCVYVMKSYAGATPMCAPILGEDPRVSNKARTACRALQVGIRAVPTVGAPLLDRNWPLLSLERKTILVVISESRNSFYSFPHRLLVRKCNVSVLIYSLLLQNFRITRVFWNLYDIGATEFCSWCLLTLWGCGSVPGSWAPRFSCHICYRSVP
jgi:hypothetical protein